MSDQPAYLLSFVPKGRAVIRDFFDTYGNVFSLLTNPPETRAGSFGMRVPAIPQLRHGEYWELAANEPFQGRIRKLRVYVDGAVIFRASADSSFLCWPKDATERVVNPVVVADSIVSFTRFVRELLSMMNVSPPEIQLGIELRNAGQSEPPLKMYAGKLRKGTDYYPLQPGSLHGVSEMHPKKKIMLPTDGLRETTSGDPFIGADRAAYRLVLGFYDMFNYSDADIPYIDREGTHPRIEVAAFAG
ncbi:MAG: hypothetical protein ABJE47_00025 [bacterium]